MDQFLEFLTGLTETSSWPPRWHCGKWSDFHGWLYISSNLLIWLAYFSIPISLFIILNKKKLPFSNLITLFILFILSCGATHLIDAIIFWEPLYRINALMLCITAIISVITAFVLVKDIPYLLSYKEPEELEKEIRQKNQAEALYKKLNEELELKVKLRTKELEQSNEELESFTSSVSHDLRSPIQNLRELIAMLKKEKYSEDAALIIDNIEKSASQASNLIQDLYNMSKNIHHHLNKQRIHTEYFLKNIITDLKDFGVISSSTTIKFSTEDFLYGDPILLKQVFVNLISNAEKYRSPERDLELIISTQPEEEYTTVAVHDNGKGFDMKKHDLIFKIFKRLEKSEDGTGIGLSIVKKIIEKHGGEIWAKSIVNDGSTFFIKLPNN